MIRRLLQEARWTIFLQNRNDDGTLEERKFSEFLDPNVSQKKGLKDHLSY